MLLAGVLVIVGTALALVAAGVLIGHAAERRSRRSRGGVLELDTRQARQAIADPDDWFEAERFRAGSHVRPFAGGETDEAA